MLDLGGTDKRFSLLRHRVNYRSKKFFSTGPLLAPALPKPLFSLLLLCHNKLVCFVLVKFTCNYSGWKPTHLTSVFSLWTTVLSLPDGTTLTAFTYVNTDVADVI